LAKNGVKEEQLNKRTGSASTASIRLRPYLQLNENHHEIIINKMRNVPLNNATSIHAAINELWVSSQGAISNEHIITVYFVFSRKSVKF